MELFYFHTGYKFEGVVDPLPVEVDDEIRRREEEELQRVLEMSKMDKGGRGNWVDYHGPGGSSSAAAASSSATTGPSASGNKYPSGYTPSAKPALSTQAQPPPRIGSATTSSRPAAIASAATQSNIAAEAAATVQRKPTQRTAAPYAAYTSPTAAPSQPAPSPAPAPVPAASVTPAVTQPPTQPEAPKPASRVRALHKFEPSEPGELGFEKGDVIKVVDRGYKDWWRGQLRGKTGIFPVNYVVCNCSLF